MTKDLVTGAGAPPHRPAVGHEEHRPHHTVTQRLGVAVGVVTAGAQDPVVAVLVADEGDGVGVGAEGGPRQGQPPDGRLEGLADPVAPGLVVTAVVDLIEDDEGALGPGAALVHGRAGGHLGVRDGDPVVVARGDRRRVGEPRVQVDPDAGRGVGPLGLEVLGGRDDRHAGDLARGQQLSCHPQREGRLAGPRRRHRQVVPSAALQVPLEGLGLPGAQGSGGTPRCPPREGG